MNQTENGRAEGATQAPAACCANCSFGGGYVFKTGEDGDPTNEILELECRAQPPVREKGRQYGRGVPVTPRYCCGAHPLLQSDVTASIARYVAAKNLDFEIQMEGEREKRMAHITGRTPSGLVVPR